MSELTYGEVKDAALQALEAAYKHVAMLGTMHTDMCDVAKENLESTAELREKLEKAEARIAEQNEQINQLHAELSEKNSDGVEELRNELKQAKTYIEGQKVHISSLYAELDAKKQAMLYFKAKCGGATSAEKLQDELKDQLKGQRAANAALREMIECKDKKIKMLEEMLKKAEGKKDCKCGGTCGGTCDCHHDDHSKKSETQENFSTFAQNLSDVADLVAACIFNGLR